jgi:hypothetical protein
MCDALERVEASVISALDDPWLRGALSALQVLKARVAAAEASLVTELGRRGDRTTLGQAVGRTEAGRIGRRAELLDAAPALAGALAAGDVGIGQVDALAALAKQMPVLHDHHDELLDLARDTSPDRVRQRARVLGDLWEDDGGASRLERQRAAVRLVRRVDDVTGMHHFGLELDPERAALLSAVIDQRVEQRFRAGEWAGLANDQRGGLALYELATSSSSDGPGAVQLGVIIDADTLMHGLHERSRIDLDGGGTVPVETIRRLGCEAEILPIVLGGPSGVLDVGRAQRMATPRQRAALRALHSTCGVPGCSVAFEHTQIHHQRWWRHGGRTDIDNMIPLCGKHHRDVHEGGWTIAIGPDRQITWSPP